MHTLKVATFNIRNGRAFDGRNSWPLRKRLVARTITELDADLVGLQEVFGFQQRFLARSLCSYSFDGRARSGGRWGERCPVLTRSPIEVRGVDTIWYGGKVGEPLPGASFPRIATIADVRLHGTDIRFVNTHLDERSDANRRHAIEELVSQCGDAPTIVVGDFNARPGNGLFDVLRSAGLRSVLPDDDVAGTSHDFTKRHDGPRIDHIVVSRHFAVQSATVSFSDDTAPASDHWPLVAELSLG